MPETSRPSERLFASNNETHVAPIYLHSERIADKRAVRRPDIVLIYRLRGDRELPPAFIPLGKGDDRRIVMLEVSYAALGLMGAREAEKRKKYEDTLERPRSDGWEPSIGVGDAWRDTFHGSFGFLEELGVRGSELDHKLLADIQMIAIGKADVCIQTESLSHEEISGRPLGGSSGKDYKRKDMV
eukprot:1196431-Prorocentrum_minimum.AAC.2